MRFSFQVSSQLLKTATRIGSLSVVFNAPLTFADTVDMLMMGIASYCKNANCSVIPASGQFVLVPVPEPSSVTMLACNVAAVVAVAYLLRRRLTRSAN